MATEAEYQMVNDAILKALTGLSVNVVDPLNDHNEELSSKGAQDVLDRLTARGFHVRRVESTHT